MRKVVHKQLIEHLERNQLINSVQSGFRGKYSSQTALECVVDDRIRTRDRNEVTGAVYLDIQKGFETVDPRR